MENSSNSAFIWSPRVIEQLKKHVSRDAIERFQTEWERLLCDMGFYMIPYSEEGIESMKNLHFWQQILLELTAVMSLKQIAKEIDANESFLQAVVDGVSARYCPITYQQGEKLLFLHREHNLPREEVVEENT